MAWIERQTDTRSNDVRTPKSRPAPRQTPPTRRRRRWPNPARGFRVFVSVSGFPFVSRTRRNSAPSSARTAESSPATAERNADSVSEEAMPLLSPLMSVFEPGRDVPCTAYHAATPRAPRTPRLRQAYAIFDFRRRADDERGDGLVHPARTRERRGFNFGVQVKRRSRSVRGDPHQLSPRETDGSRFRFTRNASANASNNASAAPRASASNDSEIAPPNVTL